MDSLELSLKKSYLPGAVVQFLSYGFVGAIAFFVDAGSLYLLDVAGLHYLLATAIAFALGLIVNFSLSKLIVFGRASVSSGALEFMIFAAIGAVGLGLTELFMFLFTDVCGLYFMMSKVVVTMVVFLWNFFARKLMLYKDS